MLYRVFLGLTALLVIFGCAGSNAILDTNSPVKVQVSGRNGAAPTDFLVSVSPNEGAATSGDALSTNQDQPWGGKNINGTRQEFAWTTISEHVPYQVWITSADGANHDFNIVVLIEGAEVYNRAGTSTPAAKKEIRIFRNSAEGNPE
jgi:hypothetical protein